jgi:tetratricopeptide (TPR) repeat protein
MKTKTAGMGGLVLVVALWSSSAAAVNVLYKVDGSKLTFKSVRWDAAKEEYLVKPVSGGEVTIPVAKKDVRRLEMDPPAEMTQALQLLAGNRQSEAVPYLQAVVSSCRGLNWDNVAREKLAAIYVKGGDPSKAIQMVDELLAAGAGASVSANMRIEYWKALLAIDPKSSKALKDLDEAIATGPREAVAIAQVLRGDLRRAAGRKDEALQDYMRTILFFENTGAVRTEALTKAIAILEEKNDTAGVAELRQKLAGK